MAGNSASFDVDLLRRRLAELSLRDAHQLGRRLERLTRSKEARRGDTDASGFFAELESAEARIAARAASVPVPSYPEELPITAHLESIRDALREHQVVVVAGETGSGKTTQLPKLCLDLGRGVRGQIGHTQPRRLAARTVADRVAEELGTDLGDLVGYTVRFNDRVKPQTLIRVMTDGILLTQIRSDPRLLSYDTLIVDEAHERSLNIDFILGYLHRLLPTRPDLKLVVTSATIDTARFAEHFATSVGTVPVVEVSGRGYPVELRYRPLPADGEDEARDQATAVCEAVDELLGEGPGDVLVFLSGEREIRDTADALSASLRTRPGGMPVEVLPLYARLSVAEQHRVFAPHPGRRVVLSTNVAETSLTVPGIRYVVDAGTARISRYSVRRKVQRLPIEPVSQASANQRSGRCGRVAPGVAIRLYDETDFLARPAFTEPEILRTNLASVILSMATAGLGDVADFPFLDPPDRRAIADGVQLLEELGALANGEITELGRRLAVLPVDPRLGRMILAADDLGALREVIVVAAALSIQDPREAPADNREAARAMHARFNDDASDFVSWLNLWSYLREQQQERSSASFRKMCLKEHLHWLRIREWQDLVAQLREVAGSIGLRWNSNPAGPAQVHEAMLTGLLTNVGMKDPQATDGSFLGPRNVRFAIFPGSSLSRRAPRWVMAAELVETSRLFARTVAKVEPEAIEAAAAHVVTRTYSEPHWERRRGGVVALERVLLYGLPLVVGRKVDYARIDPVLCREEFIRHALVEEDWDSHHRFLAHNKRLRAQAVELEERSRRRGLVIDDEALYAFYDAKIPADVVSGRHFDGWWKKRKRNHPDDLDLNLAMLQSAAAAEIAPEDFPDTWSHGGEELALHYEFAPGEVLDGVTVEVPLAVLNRIDPTTFDWGVPGLREELVTALIRSLPKGIRRSFSPAASFAAAALPRLNPAEGGSILIQLARDLTAAGSVTVTPEDFDVERVPTWLRPTFRVRGTGGAALGQDKDLAALQRKHSPDLRALVSAGTAELERANLAGWPDLAQIPVTHEHVVDGRIVRGYPALVVEANGAVALRVLTDAHQAETELALGVRRLLMRAVGSPVKSLLGELTTAQKLALASAPHANGAVLWEDATAAAVDAIVAAHGGPARDRNGFEVLTTAVRGQLRERLREVLKHAVKILTAAQQVDRDLAAAANGPFKEAIADAREQYDALLYSGFVAETGLAQLPHLPRYLQGIARRLERLPADPVRDAARTATVRQLSREYAQLVGALPSSRRRDPDVVEIRWLIEELRVSLFAQMLGTAVPVSEKRILKAMDDVEAAE
ncbi:MAG: ATP-dependent RNA helicase HrpA [Sporichthyaceae bacterium]